MATDTQELAYRLAGAYPTSRRYGEPVVQQSVAVIIQPITYLCGRLVRLSAAQ